VATVVFTETAKLLARKLIAEMPEHDGPSTPIVVVTWSGGVKDNRRGPNGEVVWETTEAAGWKSVVAPWGESEDLPLAEHTTNIDGLVVFIDPRARSATGTLVANATDGTLSVEHRTT